jgi:hypothetical protein
MSWVSRFVNVWRRGRLDRELDSEIRFHLDERADSYRRGGLSTAEAEREARRQFGNRLLMREASREVKLLPWLESLRRDVEIGLRLFRKDAVLTAAALVSLSLAIGACTAAFSLIDALVLRPLQVQDPERLVYLTFDGMSPGDPEGSSFNYPLFERLRDATRDRVRLFGMSYQTQRDVQFGDRTGDTERVYAQWVSGDAFERSG